VTRAPEQPDAAAEPGEERPRAPPPRPLPGPRLLAWARGYRREWLRRDLVAGIIVWSVVVPQAVAYAQIAELSPQAGLVAAPGALLGYALLGTSRTLVVGATTSTAALSAAAIAPLAGGDAGRFAVLSAALGLVTAGVLVASGLIGLGAVADFISKPVTTGFLFGLGLTIAVGQLPKVLGVEDLGGEFSPRLWGVLGELDAVDAATATVGIASIALLVALRRRAPAVPGILVVLVLAIVTSAALDLRGHGVDVVGELPSAFPDPTVPDVSWSDVVDLLPTAFGVMLLCTEGLGVARGLATRDRYTVDPSRELVAYRGANLLAGCRRDSSRPAARARPRRPTAPAAGRSSRRSSPPGSCCSPARSSRRSSRTFRRRRSARSSSSPSPGSGASTRSAASPACAGARSCCRASRSPGCSCSACCPASSSRPACRSSS
jgi:hypothetical protein